MSDNLENLSNAELRAKCIELGLPIIPVTDTSRNVIIKRLKSTLGGVGTLSLAKKETRRETIATVNQRASPAKLFITGNEKMGDGKRRTMDAAVTISKDQRRSVRASPVQKSNLSSVKEQMRRSPAVVILDSDDEDEISVSTQKVDQKFVTNTRRSSSRQPSLSKTTTQTTEYQNLSTVAEEPSLILDQLRKAELLKQQQEQQKRQRQEVRAQQEELQKLKQQQQQQQEEKERILNQQRVKKQLEDARSRYNPARKQPMQLIASPPITSIEHDPSVILEKSLESSIKLNKAAPASYCHINPTTLKSTSGLYPQLETLETKNVRPSFSSGYNEFSDDTDADVSKQAGGDSGEEQFDTPFLSEFARNLNRLKAEPLFSRDLSRRNTRSRTAYEVKGRNAMPTCGQEYRKDSWWQNLANFNNQYNCLRQLFLISVVAIVLYTFFKFWQ